MSVESVVSRESFSRFSDPFCELVLSYLSLEDQTRCECVSHSFRRCVYRRVQSIDFQRNQRLYKRLRCRAPADRGHTSTGNGFSSGGGGQVSCGQPLMNNRLHLNIALFESILRKCPNVTEIDFNYLIDFGNYGCVMDTITRCCHTVSTIHVVLNDRRQHEGVDAMQRFFAKFATTLQTVRAHSRGGRVRCVGVGGGDGPADDGYGYDKVVINCLKWCVNVRHLNVVYNIRLAKLFTNENECHFHRLESLEFSYKTKDKKRLESLIDANHESLKYVFVANSGSLTPTAVYTLFTQLARCRQLRRLEISIGFEQRFDYNLGHLLQQIGHECHQLVKLTVSLHFKTTPLALQTFESLKHFRHLRRLFVSLRTEPNYTANYVYNNTFFKCKPLNACKRLTHLTLADILLNDIFFYNIDKHLPRLKYLYLFSCRNYYEKLSLTDISIKMLSKLANIETIMFSERQPKIADVCVHQLIDMCPRIQRVCFGNTTFADRIDAIHGHHRRRQSTGPFMAAANTAIPPESILPFNIV